MIVVGMDLNSRKLAMSTIDPRATAYPLMNTIEVHTSVKDRAHIVGMLYAATLELISEGDIVYIETPIVAGARNIQSTIKCAASYGAVLAAVNQRRAVVVEVPVSLWKLHTVGKGNASKVDISDWLYTQHPSVHRECSGDQDLMDAACIALYGAQKERGDRGDVLPAAEDSQDPRHGGRRD